MTSFALNSIVWCYFKDGLGKTKYPESSSCDSKYLEYLCKNPIYEFDMGIIDEKDQNGFHVTLGSGIRIYLPNDNILDEYCSVDDLEDDQYFGRNIREVRKYDKATTTWQPFIFNFLSDNAIFGNYLKQLREYDEQIKTVYRALFFSYKISHLSALLPESFIYKLPLSPDTCAEPSNEDEQKYKTNSVVLIRPTMGYKHFAYDDYEHVVAIILEYVPDINKYIVSTFKKTEQMLISETQIISHINCPKDGDYFGLFINRAKRFNSKTETWEDVDERQINKDKFEADNKIYVELQSKQPKLTKMAMAKYFHEDGEFLLYLKDLAGEVGEIGLEEGIETTGSIFGSLRLDRFADAIGLAKSLAEPVRKLGYNLVNTSNEEIENTEKRIAERDKQKMQEERKKQAKLNKEEREKQAKLKEESLRKSQKGKFTLLERTFMREEQEAREAQESLRMMREEQESLRMMREEQEEREKQESLRKSHNPQTSIFYRDDYYEGGTTKELKPVNLFLIKRKTNRRKQSHKLINKQSHKLISKQSQKNSKKKKRKNL